MGAFLFFFAHTKIQKNTHIYNFIMLTNVLIIRYIVNNCKNYLSPKLTLNLVMVCGAMYESSIFIDDFHKFHDVCNVYVFVAVNVSPRRVYYISVTHDILA